MSCLCVMVLWVQAVPAAQPEAAETINFPRSLDSYKDSDKGGMGTILANRIAQEPFNLFATLNFILAIEHTFMASKFLAVAHQWETEHDEKIKAGELEPDSIHLGARLFHFLGEVEVVFGLWAIAIVGF